jgi:ATP-dependent protease ClpP protease subunit
MSGDIKSGDYEKFRLFLKQNLDKYKERRQVSLASNGGNLIEALKIAGLLKVGYADITVENGNCASACFFLYLSGVTRYSGSTSIGIHRAYFDQTYFAGLKPEEARTQQTRLSNAVNAILDENGVPQYLKDVMNRTSSDNMYWLSDDDIGNIGEHPAWYEEVLIARCRWSKTKPGAPFDPDVVAHYYLEVLPCENKIFNEQLPGLLTALAVEEKPTTKATTKLRQR